MFEEENPLMVEVINLDSMESVYYIGIEPREAVIAAFAQYSGHKYASRNRSGLKGDFNTWQYEVRYGEMVREGKSTFMLGGWSVLKREAADYIRQAHMNRMIEAGYVPRKAVGDV